MTLPPPPPPPSNGLSPATAVHEPVVDDRDAGTRRKLLFFDRIKYLLFLAALFGFFVWNEQANLPILSWEDAYRRTVDSKWWIFVLFGLEVIREIHYLISERSARWYGFWRKSFFGGFDRLLNRIPAGPRWRLGRLVRFVFFLTVLSLILGRLFDTSPVLAIVELPSRAVIALPFAFQMLFLFFVIIIQFVGLGWWISRQGINVYMPEEVKTRFADVWGQDHVVERVKENLVYLDDPDAIEAKGGYVPGGILLWGPPGTGKTLLAEAVAGETGKPYVFVEPGAFNSPVMGGGIIAVKALFRKLRKLSTRFGGVIVFFDEADVMGNRGALAGGLGGRSTPAARGAAAAPAAFHTHADTDSCNCLSYLSPMAVDTLARAEVGLDPAGPHRDGFMMGGMGMGGGGMLQSLLTEMSGLKKPRGVTNKLRKWIGMKPKAPPKYRILVMMATNMPSALDEALLRPGRLDRIYKVGYPSLEGRKRTYQGYLKKVRHTISPDEVDQIARMTPYATGATIKDLVNEALITAFREKREVITFADMLKAKQSRELGPPEDFEYVARERHAVAIHEACHAVAAYRKRHHLVIDIATIERRGDVGGFVSSIPPEDRFTHWKSEYEADLTVALASLAGERLFFEGDNSSGVGGDLRQATRLATTMEGYWGMGSTVASHGVQRELGVGGSEGPKGDGKEDGEKVFHTLGARIEDNLQRILAETLDLLIQHRYEVLAVAHALETHQTLSGPDLIAVMEGTQGPIVDGRIYKTQAFYDAIDVYHREAAAAHRQHRRLTFPLPRFEVHEAAPIPAFLHSEAVHGANGTNGTNGRSDNPWGPPPGWGQNGKH